jgi:hypothetical protein
MSKRTPQREMQAWKRRLEELAKKEARCPACARARKLLENSLEGKICSQHNVLRHRMVFGSRRMG